MAGERSAITAFVRSLDVGDFVALPPNPGRYDQGEGHDEAREVARQRGIADPNWVFWHRQSAWVFDGAGNLTAPLLIHWGGDHATVGAALSTIPAPFRVVDSGPREAFKITSDDLEAREREPFPDVSDTLAVKERIKRITAQRRKDSEWTDAEIAWLNEVLAKGDVVAQGYVVRWIAGSERLTGEAFEALMSNWTGIYVKSPKDVLVWDFLRTLARRGDSRLEAVIETCLTRPRYTFADGVSHFLAERRDPADIPRLYRLALTPGPYSHSAGNSTAVTGWIGLRAAHEGRTLADVATEALEDPAFDEGARRMFTKIVERGY